MRMKMTAEPRSLPREILKGAVAGAVATWVMGVVTSYLYKHEDPEVRREEDRARGNRTAYGVAAEKVAGMVGTRLQKEQRERLGMAIHWGLGVGTGALYAALRDHLDRVDAGYGLAMGATFWGLVDEGLNPALGLTPGPTEFPWQTHGRGLAGHLSFGVVTESTLRVLDRVL